MEIKITGAGRGTYWYAGFIGQTFEVVRDANDERGYQVIHYDPRDVKETKYYVGKEDCAVVSEVPANITVLKDENLGGVEREYREVVREARVGELVKSSVDTPPVFTVRNTGYGPGIVYGGAAGLATFPKNYVVLEPSEVIRINSARFRMVDRKAEVGERVIVTGESSACYQTGEFAKVLSSNGRVAFVDLTENTDYYDDGKWYIDRNDYRVLEPVDTAQQPEPLSEPLSAKPAPDQAAEIIVALTTRVTALEKRVAALEPSEDMRITLGEPVRSGTVVFSRPATYELPSYLSDQQRRDDIVKRAKEDVADLRKFAGTQVPNDSVKFWPRANKPTLYTATHTVEYVVNRDKRTVVAIIRCTIDGKITRGIAKCAPGDVFNVWIGKAISLRRALGLEIPEEYVSAPQPTEVRVGDVVNTNSDYNEMVVAEETNIKANTVGISLYGQLSGAYIVDDSRESDSAEPRKEVA